MKAILVPGFECSGDCQEYKALKAAFEQKGYDVLIHNPKWKLSRMSAWVEALGKIVPESGEVILLGFSVGGMISLLTATKLQVNRLIVCSPSGYFPDYKQLFQADDHKWTDEHLQDFKELSAKAMFKDLKVGQGDIVAGGLELEEWPDFRQWTHDLNDKTGWPLTVVLGVGHDLASEAYQKAVISLI